MKTLISLICIFTFLTDLKANIFTAIKEEDSRAAKILINNEKNLFSLKIEHSSFLAEAEMQNLLHYASLRGDLEIVKLLLEKGFDINQKTNKGNTPLHLAAQYERSYYVSRKARLVDYLIEKGADLNVRNRLDKTPLHVACSDSDNSLKPIKSLIKAGADTEAKGFEGKSPLLTAVSYNFKDAVRFFIAHGADFKAKDNRGRGILDIASGVISLKSGDSDYKMKTLIIEQLERKKKLKENPPLKINLDSIRSWLRSRLKR